MRFAFTETHRLRLFVVCIGIAQGFVYYLTYEFWPDTTIARALAAAVITFVSGSAVICTLSWTGKHALRLALPACTVPFVFSLVAFWVWLQLPTGDVPYRSDDVRIASFIWGAVLSLLVLLPAIQSYQATGRVDLSYPQLFHRFWNNIFIVAIAAFIVGAFWAVILLWSELFKLIDIHFFEDVFTHASFVSISLSATFAYGVALGREWEKLTTTAHSILFTILKALMPLLAAIAILFLASLPFTGLQPLWDTRHASATLLSLIALTILFFNGAFLDGTGDPPYQKWIRRVVEAALVVIPVYGAITFLALYLRIDQYGMTLGRFYATVFACFGMAVGIGYAVSVFLRRNGWLGMVPRVNMGMGCAVVACTVLLHTPVLDPFGWSARSQFNRLARGDADAAEFDYGYLRFQLGRVGYEKLAELEALSTHPQIALIEERVAETRAAPSYADVRPQPATLLAASDIIPLDSTTQLPDSLVRFVTTRLTQYQADECEESGSCTMFGVNLDSDDDLEFVLVLEGDRHYQILVYDRSDEDGDWRQVGRLRPFPAGHDLPVREVFLDSLFRSQPTTADPRYRDLVVGDLRLRVTN